MRGSVLQKMVAQKWPSAITIRDGIKLGDQLYLFKTLNEIYEKIEQSYPDDHWLTLGCWSFQQSLWKQAVKKFDAGEGFVLVSEVELEDFNAEVLSNLEDESWAKERSEYEG
jgi:hypothetical protein